MYLIEMTLTHDDTTKPRETRQFVSRAKTGRRARNNALHAALRDPTGGNITRCEARIVGVYYRDTTRDAWSRSLE